MSVIYINPFQFAAELWTPAELGATLALWLDADDTDTITLNGSTVSQWDDKSGNARHVSQATAASQPTYATADINGKPALTWPSASNNVHMLSTESFVVQDAYFVVRFDDGTTSTWNTSFQGLFCWGNTEIALIASTGPDWYGPSTFNALRYNGGPQETTTSVPALPLPNTVFSATRSTPNAGTQPLILGRDRGVTTRGWSGAIAEVIMLPATASTEDRQKLEGYLAWKWGLEANLPAGHPYESAAPTV